MKRIIVLFLAFGSTASAFAQKAAAQGASATQTAASALGTKPGGDYTQAAPPVIGIGSIIQLLLALAVVTLLLKFVLPKAAGWLNKANAKKNGQIAVIEETVPFNGGSLLVVKARGRNLLIGAGSGSLTTLADLTEVPTEPQTVFETVLEEQEQTVSAVIDPVTPAEALDRLARLIPSSGVSVQ